MLSFSTSVSLAHTLFEYSTKSIQRPAAVVPTDGLSRWAEYTFHTPQRNPAIADAVSSAPKNRHSRGSWVPRNIPPAGYCRNSEDDSSQRRDTCAYQRLYQGRFQQDVSRSDPICPTSHLFGGTIFRLILSGRTDDYLSTIGAILQA
jgi:hypothetical protein